MKVKYNQELFNSLFNFKYQSLWITKGERWNFRFNKEYEDYDIGNTYIEISCDEENGKFEVDIFEVEETIMGTGDCEEETYPLEIAPTYENIVALLVASGLSHYVHDWHNPLPYMRDNKKKVFDYLSSLDWSEFFSSNGKSRRDYDDYEYGFQFIVPSGEVVTKKCTRYGRYDKRYGEEKQEETRYVLLLEIKGKNDFIYILSYKFNSLDYGNSLCYEMNIPFDIDKLKSILDNPKIVEMEGNIIKE